MQDDTRIVYEGAGMPNNMKTFANQILALAKRGIETFTVETDNGVRIEVTLKIVEDSK